MLLRWKNFAAICCLMFMLQTTGFSQKDEVLNFINEVRTDPQTFLERRLNPFIKVKELEGNSYAQSLVSELKAANKLQPLTASPVLEKLARGHALDMGRKGQLGHNSSNGTTFAQRVRQKVKSGLIAENCDYGNEEPLDIVMSLLIDDGIQGVGHRKNLLNPKLRFIGIGIEKHATYRINCVMDFASEI
jgi:uncharacterized protein YkwD